MDHTMTSDEPTPTRREFATAVALLAVAPRGEEAQGQEAKPPGDVVADALLEIAKTRYGKHLTEEQLKLLRTSVRRAQSSAERLRQFKLHNGDDAVVSIRADLLRCVGADWWTM